MTVKVHGTLDSELLSRPELRPLLGREVEITVEETAAPTSKGVATPIREVDINTDPGWAPFMERVRKLRSMNLDFGYLEEMRAAGDRDLQGVEEMWAEARREDEHREAL